MPALRASSLSPALLLSLLAHVAFGGLSVWRASALPAGAAQPSVVPSAGNAGDTFEVEDPSQAPAARPASPPTSPAPRSGPEPDRPAAPAAEPGALPADHAQPPAQREPDGARTARARRPRKHRPPRSKPPGSASAATQQPASPAVTGSGSAGDGRYGATGALPGVRSLDSAFVRALARAALSDPSWLTLPVSAPRSLDVELAVDADGRLVHVVPRGEAPSPELAGAVGRARLMLGAGQFALRADQLSAGQRKYRLRATIRQEKPDDDVENAADTREIGFDPASAAHPGRAYFTYKGGRHVEIQVTILE